MADHWSVTVTRNHEEVVCIESNSLSGREISDEDERAIEIAARALLGFIGAPQPPERDEWGHDSSWDVMDLDLREVPTDDT